MNIYYKAVLISWLVLLLSLLSPLINPDYQYFDIDFLLFFAMSFIVFYFSAYLSAKFISFKSIQFSSSMMIRLLLSVAFIALFFRLIDRFYLRPVVDVLSIASVRESKEAGVSNIFSQLAAILLPFAIVLYVSIKKHKVKLNKTSSLAFGMMISICILDVLSSGSRGLMLMILVGLFSPHFTFKRLLLLIPVGMVISGLFFIVRFMSLTGQENITDILFSMSSYGYALFVPASDFTIDILLNNSLGFFFFPILQTNQYLAHGIFEFAYLFHTGPDIQFDPTRIIPHLSMLLDTTSYVERVNLYYTMVGSFYIAFGAYSLVGLVFFGLYVGSLIKASENVGLGASGIMCVTLFLSPFVNSAGGYDVHFYHFAILICAFIKIKK